MNADTLKKFAAIAVAANAKIPQPATKAEQPQQVIIPEPQKEMYVVQDDDDTPPAPQQPQPTDDEVEFVEYSEKSFAVFGKGTKAYKDRLGQLGSWNRNLRYKDGSRAGWIFSKKKREAVDKLLNP